MCSPLQITEQENKPIWMSLKLLVPPTTRDNSVQSMSLIKENKYLITYAIITQFLNIIYFIQKNYIMFALTIPEHENKGIWLPLGYSGHSNDERQHPTAKKPPIGK